MIQMWARFRNADGELTWTRPLFIRHGADPLQYLTPYVRANMVRLETMPAITSPDDRYNPVLGTYG